jgi:hypothetical protein
MDRGNYPHLKRLVNPRDKVERRNQKRWKDGEKFIDKNAQPVTEKIIAELGSKAVFLVTIKPPTLRYGRWAGAVINGLGSAVETKLQRLGVNLAFNEATTSELSTEEVDGPTVGLPSGMRTSQLINPITLVFEPGDEIKAFELLPPDDWLQTDD